MVEDGTFRRVGPDSAQKLVERRDALVLDVRDEASFERGHIAGANHANEANLFDFLSSAPKDKPVLIYCYHGNSSQIFAKAFIDFQFREVFSLDGGDDGWVVAQRQRPFEPKAAPTSNASEAPSAGARTSKS